MIFVFPRMSPSLRHRILVMIGKLVVMMNKVVVMTSMVLENCSVTDRGNDKHMADNPFLDAS